LARAPYLFEKIGAPAHEPSYRSALLCFTSAARRGEQLKPDFFDGYDNLKIIEAAEQSASTGRRIQMLAASAQPSVI
jgi:predicted dehydrogenase